NEEGIHGAEAVVVRGPFAPGSSSPAPYLRLVGGHPMETILIDANGDSHLDLLVVEDNLQARVFNGPLFGTLNDEDATWTITSSVIDEAALKVRGASAPSDSVVLTYGLTSSVFAPPLSGVYAGFDSAKLD